MARLTKDTSSRGQKTIGDSLNKAPSKTLVIPAKDLVQVIAKVLLCYLRVLLSFFRHSCDNNKQSWGLPSSVVSFVAFQRNIMSVIC